MSGHADRALRSRSATRAAYVPLGARVPRRARRSSRRERVLERAAARCSSDAAAAKIAADVKRERMVLAPLGIALRGLRFDTHARELPHRSRAPQPRPRRHRALRARAAAGRHRQGAARAPRRARSSSPSETVEATAAQRRARSSQLMLRAHAVLEPELRAASAARSCSRDMELPLARVLVGRGARPACASTPAQLARMSDEVATQLVQLERAARARRPRLQRRLAAPARDDPVRRAQAAGRQEAPRPRARPTPTCSKSWRCCTSCRRRSSSTACWPSSRAPTSTRCRAEVNPRTGRIHTDFRQAVAATGRLSSTDPNLQNIPIRTELGRSIRDAFVAARRAGRSCRPTTRRSSCACWRI